MSWRERLDRRLRPALPWLDRWVRPVLLSVGMLLAAAATAWLVVRLMTLALGRAASAYGDAPFSLLALPAPRPETMPETPQEAAERKRGTTILLAGLSALLILVLAAAVVQTLTYDQRPADFFIPVGARPMPGAERLQGYHWVDQPAGVVQIPIERAIDLLAQRGLPARDPNAGQAFRDEGQGGPSDSSGGRRP